MQTEALQFEGRHNTLSQQSQWLLIDSSQNDLVLTIWPKGKFNYNLVNGFEGEAERIAVHTKQRIRQSLQLKQAIKQDSVVFKANYANKKASTSAVQQNKISAGNNWTLVLVLLMVLALIWGYYRFRR